MPVATLTFNLADFDDADAHAKAVAGPNLVDTLRGIEERLRRACKDDVLDGKPLTESDRVLLDRVYEIVREEADLRSVRHLLEL